MAHGPSRLIDDLLDVPFLDGLLICHLGVLDCVRLARSCLRGREVTARTCGRFEVLWRHATSARHGPLSHLCSRLGLYPTSARKLIVWALSRGAKFKGSALDSAVEAQLPLETIVWLHQLGAPIRNLEPSSTNLEPSNRVDLSIYAAATSGRLDIVRFLWSVGGRGNHVGIRCAVVSHQWHVVQYILEQKKIHRHCTRWLERNGGLFLGRATRALNKRIALEKPGGDDKAVSAVQTEDGLLKTDVQRDRFELEKEIALASLAALPRITEMLIALGAVIEPDSGDSD